MLEKPLTYIKNTCVSQEHIYSSHHTFFSENIKKSWILIALKFLSSLGKKCEKANNIFACLVACLADLTEFESRAGMFRTAAAPSANNKKTNFCSETLKLALNWPLTDPSKRGHIKPLFCTLLRKFHVMTSTYFQNWGSNSGWNWTVVVKLKPQQKISGEYVPHGP